MKNLLTEQQRQKLLGWWEHKNTGRPVLMLSVLREDAKPNYISYETPAEMYLGVDKLVHNFKEMLNAHDYRCEKFPTLDLNLGAGSLALYLGSEPTFAEDTLWFGELPYEELSDFPKFEFNPENPWFQKHMEIIRKANELSEGKFITNIPDIIENLDILAALRGPQNLCYDLFDDRDLVKEKVQELDEIYMKYYDAFYDIVKLEDGSCAYTAFDIWSPGKTAKIQCDFAALISPDDFAYIVTPSLTRQCEELDYCIYHLDGKECIVQLDSLMSIQKLRGIQWTQGAGNPDCFDEKWFDSIYDKVMAHGKSLHLHSSVSHNVDYWIDGIDRLMNRYGPAGLYIQLPAMTEKEYETLMEHSAKYWE